MLINSSGGRSAGKTAMPAFELPPKLSICFPGRTVEVEIVPTTERDYEHLRDNHWMRLHCRETGQRSQQIVKLEILALASVIFFARRVAE